jgi:hypothetical protein
MLINRLTILGNVISSLCAKSAAKSATAVDECGPSLARHVYRYSVLVPGTDLGTSGTYSQPNSQSKGQVYQNYPKFKGGFTF